MFLILIVGMALFAFVLDPSSIQNFFSSTKVNSIGQINGEDIDREEFARQVEAYRTQTGNRTSQIQAANVVWDGMVSERVLAKQIEEARIVVGEKDIWDAMIELPEIQNSPLFKNEANLFDQEKLKEYIANMQDNAVGGNNQAWMNWLATEKSIKQNLELQSYTALLKAGLGASLVEGERDYLYQNTKMDVQFVYIPYASIADSLAYVTSDEIKAYLNENKKQFKPEASRSLKFIKFDIDASEQDESDLKAEVESYLNDRDEYSNAAKATVTVKGLKNTTDYEAFINENKSDLGIDNGYKYKNQIAPNVAEEVFNAALGDVIGAYKENGYFKISKVTEIIDLPDSVKSSHILVGYIGATRSTSTKTKEEAKKSADSIFSLVRNNKSKYTEIADSINTDGTKGKGGDIGWVVKNQAFSQSFDKDFADFIYKNATGSIEVVETAFGFHVIRIDEQTNPEKAVKLATFSRAIEASEVTENDVFEKAETVASNLVDGQTIDEIATAQELTVQSALNLKALDENIPSLNAQRQIVTWAFSNENEVGTSKRFDIDVAGKRGYAVVVIDGKTEEDGITLTTDMLAKFRPQLVNEKKAAQIAEKMKGATLEEIAKNNGVSTRSASSVTLASPLISGVGNEPGVVGALSTIPVDKISGLIEGVKGVFVVKVIKREDPLALENYNNFRKLKATSLKGRTFQMFDVLEEAADIKDFRSKFF